MKKFIKKFNDYRYRKRLKKFFAVNIKFSLRKVLRFLKSEKLNRALTGTPAIMSYISVLVMAVIVTATALFAKYALPYFSNDAKILRRLTMTEYDTTVPYLNALNALGSSNRIQVTLKTETENYIRPKGVDLDRGSINITLTFSDGTITEFGLTNRNYDNFESGMTDTFTLILPYGYTPFDIIDYTLTILPDIDNTYDNWHCSWARVYFLLGGKPVMLAQESWETYAVFGDGDASIKQSSLTVVHDSNENYKRTQKLYSYYLTLASNGMTDFASSDVKSDALDSFSVNGGKYLLIDIETVNIEVQNDILTYYTKGVDIPETDSLDYDGLIYLDVTFYSAWGEGMYTKSYLLDTLGTDDFELGTTSTFKLEMPEGMCVFDIRSISIRADNPYDAWAPRMIRAYIKPDYCEMLEIARLNNTMLVQSHATPVFYKNLIDLPVELDLTAKFAISNVIKRQIETEKGFSFGSNTSAMYFELMSFYDRQLMFYDRMCELYSESVYAPETEPEPEQTPVDDEIALPLETEPKDTNEQRPEDEQTTQTPSTDQTVTETPKKNTPVTETPTVETPPAQTPTEQTPTTEIPTVNSPSSDTATDNTAAEDNTENITPDTPPEDTAIQDTPVENTPTEEQPPQPDNSTQPEKDSEAEL